MTFLEYIENGNNFKRSLKTDSELAVDDDLVLKSNQIVIPSDLQNHVIQLPNKVHLGIVKTKWLIRNSVKWISWKTPRKVSSM